MGVSIGQEMPRRIGHMCVMEPARSCVSDTMKRMNS